MTHLKMAVSYEYVTNLQIP